MLRLELTLPTPAENVALDEALLDWVEGEKPEQEVLRLWESPQPMVVVGRASRVHLEVNEAICRTKTIPILRRSSGGAAVVAGPGCLMYAVVLSYALRPELKDIRLAHAYVLGRMVEALRPIAQPGEISQAGTSDLVLERGAGSEEQGKNIGSSLLNPRPSLLANKFSGNSMRAKRSHLLYHGTLLYHFDLPLVATCLKMPPRQPSYRGQRGHDAFVTNLPVAREELIAAVDEAWPTQGPLIEWPAARVSQLIAERFGNESWNYEFR